MVTAPMVMTLTMISCNIWSYPLVGLNEVEMRSADFVSQHFSSNTFSRRETDTIYRQINSFRTYPRSRNVADEMMQAAIGRCE